MAGDMGGRLRGRAGFDDEHVSVALHGKLAEKARRTWSWWRPEGWSSGCGPSRTSPRWQPCARLPSWPPRPTRPCSRAALPGRTEREVAISSRFMEDQGAEDASFEPIVAAGAHGAPPHAVPRDEVIGRTRSWWWTSAPGSTATARTARGPSPRGSSDDTAREVYELVLRAQQEALGAVRGGRRAAPRRTPSPAT